MPSVKAKTQIQVVQDFLDGATEGRSGSGGNLIIKGDQLIHYQTVIAERYGHNGYTQEAVAQALNIDRSLLSHVEAGKKGCSVDLLIQLSLFFEVSIDYIVLGTVHSDLIRLNSTKQVKESIESLICHLETFSKRL